MYLWSWAHFPSLGQVSLGSAPSPSWTQISLILLPQPFSQSFINIIWYHWDVTIALQHFSDMFLRNPTVKFSLSSLCLLWKNRKLELAFKFWMDDALISTLEVLFTLHSIIQADYSMYCVLFLDPDLFSQFLQQAANWKRKVLDRRHKSRSGQADNSFRKSKEHVQENEKNGSAKFIHFF